ncbi:MAG: TRAP transporter small permease [Pseudomonadota bacterium]
MRRFLDGIYLTGGILSAVSVFLICALMITQSVAREFGVKTAGTNDVVAWLCAAAAFLSMAHAFKHGDFVRVTLLSEKVSDKTRRGLELLSLLLATIAVGYLTWWATKFTYESWQFNEIANGMVVIPLWIPQLSFVAGAWMLLLAVIDELFVVLSGSEATYVVAVRERHANGDFSSDV